MPRVARCAVRTGCTAWCVSHPRTTTLSVVFEILDRALVLFCRCACAERAEVSSLAGPRVGLAGIQPVLSRTQLPNHGGLLDWLTDDPKGATGKPNHTEDVVPGQSPKAGGPLDRNTRVLTGATGGSFVRQCLLRDRTGGPKPRQWPPLDERAPGFRLEQKKRLRQTVSKHKLTGMGSNAQPPTKPHCKLSSEERKAAILRAVRRVFAEKGFDGTTTRALADAAGVSEALLFKHFPNKEALFSAMKLSLNHQDLGQVRADHRTGALHLGPRADGPFPCLAAH